MPRKKNNRKAIQQAKRAAAPKPKKARVATIGHVSAGNHGLAMAALASVRLRDVERGLLSELRDRLKADLQ